MPRAWTRATSINNNAFGTFGYVSLASLFIGNTVLHSYWSLNLWGTWGSVAQYPPGSSIVRAGLIAEDILSASPPTPITNESHPWMDILTLQPIGQIAISTNVDWSYTWNTGQGDRNVKVRRKNQTTGTQGLWVAWEISVAADALAGFAVSGWSATLDAYIET